MPKPINSKSLQLYPKDELYDKLKTLVDSGEYRSLNVAAIALIEIGLSNHANGIKEEPLTTDSDRFNEAVNSLISDRLAIELPALKDQILGELPA